MVIITKFNKEDFENILNSYNIGKYKSHKHLDWALTNTVYKIETTKGKFILKIFENSDPKFINYQIKIIDFLANNKIPVAKISKLKDGKELLMYRKKRILIQKFIKGVTKERINDELLKNIAKNFGLMNKTLLKLKLKEKYAWKKDHQFKPSKGKIGNIDGFNFKDHEKKLLHELKTLQRKKLRRSILHGDFHGVNLLIKGNRLSSIIDFDDAHEDYIAYEVAVFMIDPFVRKKLI